MILPIITERLILRPFREADKPAFAAMNGDAEVMRHFPEPLSEGESNVVADRLMALFEETGLTFFATEEQASGRFIGIIGLRHLPDRFPIAPNVEVGWRLIADVWNRGYATEGARAVLTAGFVELNFPSMLAYTTPDNRASRRVMEKVGLIRDSARDFEHPDLPAEHPMQRHVVYSAERETWLRATAALVL